MTFNMAFRDEILPDDFDFSDSEILQDVPTVIPPGTTLETGQLEASMENVEAVIQGKKHCYIWGWAEYDDIFEGTPRHRTEFCHKWTIGGNPRNIDRFSSRYSTYHKYNGADEECEGRLKTVSLKNP